MRTGILGNAFVNAAFDIEALNYGLEYPVAFSQHRHVVVEVAWHDVGKYARRIKRRWFELLQILNREDRALRADVFADELRQVFILWRFIAS